MEGGVFCASLPIGEGNVVENYEVDQRNPHKKAERGREPAFLKITQYGMTYTGMIMRDKTKRSIR
jgi:hypothetical protein